MSPLLKFLASLALAVEGRKGSWSEFIPSHCALFEGKHTLTCPMEKQSAWVQFDLTLLVDCDLNQQSYAQSQKSWIIKSSSRSSLHTNPTV